MEGHGLRVLVVEDNDGLRSALSDGLEAAGYNVFALADGLAALQELKKRHFDVVLTDYQMPGINGLELLVNIQDFVPDTRVIVVSGQPNVRQIALDRGAFAWILKPASLPEVLSVLRQAMPHASASASHG